MNLPKPSPRFVVVGKWNPTTWPKVGDEKSLPFNAGTIFQLKISAVVEGQYIEANHDGVTFRGYPERVIDSWGEAKEILELWNWRDVLP